MSNPGSAVPVWHDRGNPSERVYMQGVRSGVPLPHSGVVDLTSAEHFPRHRTYRAASGAIDGATGHTFTAVRPWTTNVNGNTATRRLSIQEAQPHEGSIDNEMRERRLMKQMRQVAAKIGELLVKEIARAARRHWSQAQCSCCLGNGPPTEGVCTGSISTRLPDVAEASMASLIRATR